MICLNFFEGLIIILLNTKYNYSHTLVFCYLIYHFCTFQIHTQNVFWLKRSMPLSICYGIINLLGDKLHRHHHLPILLVYCKAFVGNSSFTMSTVIPFLAALWFIWDHSSRQIAFKRLRRSLWWIKCLKVRRCFKLPWQSIYLLTRSSFLADENKLSNSMSWYIIPFTFPHIMPQHHLLRKRPISYLWVCLKLRYWYVNDELNYFQRVIFLHHLTWVYCFKIVLVCLNIFRMSISVLSCFFF